MYRLLLLNVIFIVISYANILQDAINNAKSGSTLKLSKGIYKGQIYINKPLSIVGIEDGVIIDANNIGTTISIYSSNVTLKNLKIINSGNRIDKINGAILLKNVNNITINSCILKNNLYGIYLDMVNDSNISQNYINSKKTDISLKGDSLKIYYSKNNIIINNTIENSRDISLQYSHNNIIKNNKIINNRFALSLEKSNNNKIENNLIQYNSVGIIAMGIKNLLIKNNQIKSSKGAAGIGLMISGGKNIRIKNNIIKFNSKALYIDSKSKEQDMRRYIVNNEISYNKEAIHFHQAIKNNTFINNNIFGNIDDVVKDVEGDFSKYNNIKYNYWDRYAGFDRDKDKVGDNPYLVYQYADKLWHYNHKVKFFYASPIMSLMNFLSSLAPFIEPNLLFRDDKPMMNKIPIN